MKKFTFVAALMTALIAAPVHAQGQHYIALGDSYALGYTTAAAPPTNGDAGYVAPFANFLSVFNGGVRPTVNNLAISGESSSSFLTGAQATIATNPAPLVDAPLRNPTYNTNYNGLPNATQQVALFNATVDSIVGGGGSVPFVTLQVGGNDILGLLAQPNFQQYNGLQQLGIINNQFAQLQTNYVTILTAVRAKLPTARIFTVGYADPLPGLGALNPLPNSALLTANVNNIIQGVSQAFGATYVDIYTPFVGNEATYTRVLTSDNGIPNIHPTPLGYQVIAQQLTSSVAPEPGAFALILPVVGVALVTRRKRA